MLTLVACSNPKINEYYAVKMIGEGIEPHKANDKQELFEQLEKRNIDVLILDAEAKQFEGMQTLKEIKTHHNQTVIIILTYQTGLDFAKKMQEIGIHGFISKTEEFENQIQKTLILLDNLKTKRKEQRKYMRVKPNSSHINNFILTIPGLDKKYEGKVIDISLGGVAATMNTIIHDSLLYKGLKVDSTFHLNKTLLNSEGQILRKKGNAIILTFRNLSSLNRKKLSEYIISRIE